MMRTLAYGFKKLPRTLLFFSVLLLALLVTMWAQAGQMTLSWDANTEPDLAGYKLHYGTASGSYTVHLDVQNVTTYTVTGLADGQTYYFAATAYDSAGNESEYSNEVSHSIPVVNEAPSTPSIPSGPATAGVNTTIGFTTSATDSDGSSIEYRYDWGGGVLSSWGTAGRSHGWSAAGVYTVKAQARDSHGVESAWSGAKTVTIFNPAQEVEESNGEAGPDSQDAFPNEPEKWADENGSGTGDNPDAAETADNPAPDAPLLVSPVNDEVVSTQAVLETGELNTAAAGGAHAKTRWQVFRNEDDACVLDIQSAKALTRLAVPKLVLDEGTGYFWRAQFIDSNAAASDWSDYEYFATAVTDRDLNANGILDSQEVDSTVDLDKDGVKDNQQLTNKSVRMEGTRVQIGVSIKDCPTAIAVEAVESEDPRQPDGYASSKPKRMPFGLINFKIAVANAGDSAAVKLYFSEPAPVRSKWFKYDPIADRWYDFSAYAKFAKDRRSITLSLQDGGSGDADGIANGVIVDPAGIVEDADAEIVSGDAGASSGGSGGGGCFISSATSGVVFGKDVSRPWLVLCLMVAAGLVFRISHKRVGV